MNRDTYVRETRTRFDDWNNELDGMKLAIDHLEADARQTYNSQLANLRRNWREAMNEFEQVEHAGEDIWQQLKTRVDAALDRLERAFADARQSFREGGMNLTGTRTYAGSHSSEGWPEGQGRQVENSEGWTEGLGTTREDSDGWPEGQGDQVGNSAGWPEGQKNRVN
jgi:hypothetical protein